MLSDSDILETEIDEKYIFQQKTKKNFFTRALVRDIHYKFARSSHA